MLNTSPNIMKKFKLEIYNPVGDLYNDKEDESYKILTPATAGFNYVVLMVGTALVATPSAFSLTSPYLGVPTEIILGCIAWFSAISIFNASCITKATSFQDLGKRLFGRNLLGNIINFLIITLPLMLYLMGSLGGYIIIASEVIFVYVDVNLSLIKILCTLLCALLGILNTFNKVRFISYAAAAAIVLVLCTIQVTTAQLWNQLSYPLKPITFATYITGLPILALALNGHLGLPGMSNEMTAGRQKYVNYFTLAGQSFVFVVNTSIGFFPSLLMGDQVTDDIMGQYQGVWRELYNTTNIAILIAQCFLAFIVIIQAPLLILPMKEVLLDHHGKTVRERSWLANTLSSFLLAFIAGLLAVSFNSLFTALNTVATIGSLLIIGPTSAILTYKTQKGFIPMMRAHLLMIAGLILLVSNIYTIIVQFS